MKTVIFKDGANTQHVAKHAFGLRFETEHRAVPGCFGLSGERNGKAASHHYGAACSICDRIQSLSNGYHHYNLVDHFIIFAYSPGIEIPAKKVAYYFLIIFK